MITLQDLVIVGVLVTSLPCASEIRACRHFFITYLLSYEINICDIRKLTLTAVAFVICGWRTVVVGLERFLLIFLTTSSTVRRVVRIISDTGILELDSSSESVVKDVSSLK